MGGGLAHPSGRGGGKLGKAESRITWEVGEGRTHSLPAKASGS